VYYAAYYAWFERTSTEWWLARGIRIPEMLDRFGVAIASRASGCEYLATTRLFDELACRMYISAIGTQSMTFAFDVVRDDGTMVGSGFNTLVTLVPEIGAVPIPASLREILVSDASDGGD
jgi:acyl-CoA thioesterase FadM